MIQEKQKQSAGRNEAKLLFLFFFPLIVCKSLAIDRQMGLLSNSVFNYDTYPKQVLISALDYMDLKVETGFVNLQINLIYGLLGKAAAFTSLQFEVCIRTLLIFLFRKSNTI